MASDRVPDDWGQDSLSQFLDTAQRNTIATFVNVRHDYNRLRDINTLYADLIHNLINTPDWFSAFFLLRAHASYLGAVRLATSGQAGETYMVIRGCLENALYGLYFHRNPNSIETWLSRTDSSKAKKRVRNEFTARAMLSCLESVDPDTHRVADYLYQRTIEFGAHPNKDAVLSVLTKSDDTDAVHFQLRYLAAGAPMALAMKTTAQVGVCSLHIFQHVFKERFEIMQLTDRLRRLESGL
jgi:hypothetical protein